MENPEVQAREWFMRVQSGELSDQQQEALADWLCESPENLAAYQHCEAVWEQLGRLDTAEMPVERDDRAEGALWQRLLSAAGARLNGDFFPGWKVSGLALASITALVFGVLLWNGQPTGPDALKFETGIGEVATYQLDDGSELTLGARSRVRVVMSESVRRVDVQAGRGYFDVVSDPARPFHVYAHDARVEVVGTQFDVLRTERRVTVSVREGIVDVLAAGSDRVAEEQPSVTLRAGNRVSKERHETFSAIDTLPEEDISAWRQGRLVYHRASLDDVVDELNRYSSDRFTLASPDLGDIELTASFQIDQLDTLPELLSKTLPVRVQEESDGHYIVFPASVPYGS